MKSTRSLAGRAFALLMLGAAAGFAAGSVELASRIDPGQVSDTASGDFQRGPFPVPAAASLSADGRYAAFLSSAANLVTGQRDVNGSPGAEGQDVFLADLVTGTMTLVSHALGLPNTTGNQGSAEAAISADGRWVVFRSSATDLASGQQGRRSPFHDDDLLLYDRITGAITLVAATQQEQAYFQRLGISADGRYITYDSDAYDLIPGQQGGFSNVFLYDRVDGSTRLISHVPGSPTTGPSEAGASDARISADGRFISFLTDGGDLLPGQISTRSVVLYNRGTDTLTLVGPGELGGTDISSDGKYVAFSKGDTLALYTRETGTTAVVSTVAAGTNDGNFPRLYALSADGRFLVFSVRGGTTIGLAVYDRASRVTTPVSRPSGAPPVTRFIGAPTISADGRFIVFSSTDPAWVAGQTDTNTPLFDGSDGSDVFLLDRTAGKILLVSHAAASPTTTGNAASYSPAISANGARVLHLSQATNLAEGLHDLNQRPDLFAYDVSARSNQAVTLRAPALPSLSSPADSQATALSADGRFLAYESTTSSAFNTQDVFLYDALAKTRLLVNHVPNSAMTPARGNSLASALSADGRYVAFYSNARNLVPGANANGAPCLFLFDRITGTVTFVARTGFSLVLQDERFLPKPRLSADGRWLAFTSDAPDVVPGQQEQVPDYDPTQDVFLFDRVTAKTTLVSHSAAGLTVAADSASFKPVLSADGRYLAFLSGASDLLPGETRDPNDGPAAYLYDGVTGTRTLLSHPRSSPLTAISVSEDLAMSSDGRYIALATTAGDLDPNAPSNGGPALYVYDRVTGAYQRVASAGYNFQQEVALSADGRMVAFAGRGGLLPGVGPGLYLYDRMTKSLSFAAEAELADGRLALSGDGRYTAFASETPGLLPGLIRTPGWDGTDIYLYDRVTGTTSLVDQWQGSAVTAAGFAYGPLLSADGRRIAFTSGADLVAGDYNRQLDAYLFSLDGGTPGGPVTVPPCILFDTRRPANGPALRSNAARVVKATGLCGVPATAKRVTVKVTVFQGTGQGNVRFYPGDLAAPSSGILRFSRGQSRSATFDLPVAPNGAGTLTLLPFVGGNGTVGVSVEIDGYTP